MLDTSNQLVGSFSQYFSTYRVEELVQRIPEKRRQLLAETIEGRAGVMGCKDEVILKTVLRRLQAKTV